MLTTLPEANSVLTKVGPMIQAGFTTVSPKRSASGSLLWKSQAARSANVLDFS
eukprot:CAMPEP_0170462714 /NCGR_PEP_ID=MMETSP0123-20130129/8112_1 /TAXON_ID=182087 /ORGANISM="Favella ehrenbergii, Strain Fehren 1" /LENGTH=52 /DNA_ID=CAMNT_0010727995 /DNA_START=504 /DNA_END=662 /DNA_ORIENTATION=-